MFPTSSARGSTSIPPEATFWMPRREDIDEEGIGCAFRGTWLIKDVPVREARRLVEEERRIATAIGELATDAEHFDRLAHAVEAGYEFALPGGGRDPSAGERSVLDEFTANAEPAELDGLELGVAGLVYALATVRIIPAASCRGHAGDRPWSDAPVVLFAATRYRAAALQPLVEGTNCTFDLDPARSDLLVVRGRTILDTMALADAVLDARAAFVQPRPSIPTVQRRRAPQQEGLF